MHAQANDGPKSIRSEQSAAPSDRRSPIMSDNDCLIRADRVEQSDHVSGQMQQSVLIDRIRFVRLPETTHVGRDGTISGGSKCFQLVPP